MILEATGPGIRCRPLDPGKALSTQEDTGPIALGHHPCTLLASLNLQSVQFSRSVVSDS